MNLGQTIRHGVGLVLQLERVGAASREKAAGYHQRDVDPGYVGHLHRHLAHQLGRETVEA